MLAEYLHILLRPRRLINGDVIELCERAAVKAQIVLMQQQIE